MIETYSELRAADPKISTNFLELNVHTQKANVHTQNNMTIAQRKNMKTLITSF
jgi:hypothetical protein